MTICRFSITRPVATTVLMLLVVVFGLVSMQRLPVRELPDIEEPTLSITTSYEGASAAVVETRITQIIEDAVAGLDGLRAIEGTSQDGQSRVMLEFRAERNIDAAANDVRDRVARVLSRLPDEATSPVVAKYDSNAMPVIVATVTSTHLTPMELTDYVKRYLLDRFSTVDGVAMAGIWGPKTPSMRVWLDRRAMAARGVAAGDVEAALRSENVEFPGGRVESLEREFTVRVQRGYHTPEDFMALVVLRTADGELVRLGDVAEVRVEPAEMRELFAVDGAPAVSVSVSKQSTGNTLTVSKGVRKMIKELEANLPEGMSISIRRDEALFINASIKEVRASLMIAGALVVLVIFLFLGNIRASLVPAITVPISLVGSMTVLHLAGYSINLLTLLALVLAIGMVVDDAIVIIENTHRRIEEGEKPLLAAVRGSEQVLFAVISTTAVLVAVFLPISLWEGKTGRLFSEFAVAMTAAVAFSSLVALTLAPMLCSKLFKGTTSDSRLTRVVDHVMDAFARVYGAALRGVAKAWVLTLLVFAAIGVLMVWGWQRLSSEYEPVEDRGMISVGVEAPEGTGFYAMNGLMREAVAVFDELMESGDGENIMEVQGGWGARTMNNGRLLINFSHWDNRTNTTMRWRDRLRPKMNAVPSVRLLPQLPSGIGSRGNPVQFVIGGPDYRQLLEWRDIFDEAIKGYPGLTDANYDYKETTPQLDVSINRDRADELGVPLTAIGGALETLLGSKKVTTYVDRGQEYDVILQAGRADRATPTDLANIYVRSRSGNLVPLDNLVTLVEKGDAARLNRFNRVRAITLSGNAGPGYALGDVLGHLEKTADEKLPEYKQIGYKGQSRDLKDSTGSMYFIFALALLVSFLALAWQFESFISPFVVMLTVPLGMIGAVAGLNMMGFTMNTYTQIGIIMLIGLAAKNGILIVEFANQLRDEGMAFEQAIFEASRMRLRPILMTAITTVAGAIPLLLATGAGAMSRRMIGAVVVYGGLSACFLTIFIVPVGYLVFARFGKSPKALQHRLETIEKEEAGKVEG
ncbi:MAG: efflux RND transporter permease subunit [Kiritimatiellaeota bacterium]|nr:efflux RND transporter permease subunit [Kiritimatiellota bacterium]